MVISSKYNLIPYLKKTQNSSIDSVNSGPLSTRYSQITDKNKLLDDQKSSKFFVKKELSSNIYNSKKNIIKIEGNEIGVLVDIYA